MALPLRAIIAPSMLSSDFANLSSEAARMEADGADWLHMDVMDGHFVPNLTIGAPVIKALRRHTRAVLDCHLMVSRPEQWVDDFAAAGASTLTFHVEATEAAAALVERIASKGMLAGVAIKPATSASALAPLLASPAGPLVHHVLVMTVEPGFGGQSFMHATLDKVRELRAAHPRLNIQVDGGLGPDNIAEAAAAGANIIVAGTSVFGAKVPRDVIALLRAAVDAALAHARPVA